jgi:hypothetical protein
MRLIRNRGDPLAQEEGYALPRPHAAAFLDALRQELAHAKDPFIQGWLLELIGDARSNQAFPIVVGYLLHPDTRLQHWARDGLFKLAETREGRRIIGEWA